MSADPTPDIRLTFWGVRGSTPCPGARTVRYGGNTPCLQIRFNGVDRTFIVDAGTGIRNLGDRLSSQHDGDGCTRIALFLTHTHWDHIMGFPFFSPIYDPKTRITVYGPTTLRTDSLERTLANQLAYAYFPVRHADLPADIRYVELAEGDFDLGDGVRLQTRFLNHPLLCLGYRFEFRGKSVCTVYDTEPFRNPFAASTDVDRDTMEMADISAREGNRRIEAFMAKADILVHDAQYTEAEYAANRTGWGHTPMEQAVASAARAGVGDLVLFHHDPCRTDEDLDRLDRHLRETAAVPGLGVRFAMEGETIAC